jgi:hypothetical protein
MNRQRQLATPLQKLTHENGNNIRKKNKWCTAKQFTTFATVVQTATHRTVLHDDALMIDQQALQWTDHPAQIALILVILI